MTRSTFDDELTDVKTKATPATSNKVEPQAASQPAVDATVKASTEKHTPDIDLDEYDLVLDHDKLKGQPGLISVLPKELNKVTRWSPLNFVKAVMLQTHFLAGAGPSGKGTSVICPGENCSECSKGSEHSSRRKIGVLAVKYEVDAATGKFPPNTVKPIVSIGYLALSPSAYNDMTATPSEGETVFDIDFRTSKKASGIGWVFNRQSSPPAFVKAGMEAEVRELAQPYLDRVTLRARLGKVVTAMELKAMLSGTVDPGKIATLEDIGGFD
jgi:hypothetical protein